MRCQERRFKTGYIQMEKWSILNDTVKYVQYNQHPIGYYDFEVKAPEERYGTEMYKRLQVGEREIKELSFDLNYERLNRIVWMSSQMSCIQLNIMKIVT